MQVQYDTNLSFCTDLCVSEMSTINLSKSPCRIFNKAQFCTIKHLLEAADSNEDFC